MDNDEDDFFYYDPASPSKALCGLLMLALVAGLIVMALRVLARWLV